MEKLNTSFFEENYSLQIQRFIKQYTSNPQPIDVNFREIVAYLKQPNRATHLIHRYPAKLLMHIPHFFLQNTIFSKKGDNILDPFCGSGTVLLESLISGRNCFGCDSNPLARLISKVKTIQYNPDYLIKYKKKLSELLQQKQTVDSYIPKVINMDLWFYSNIQKELIHILNCIHLFKEDVSSKYIDFFLLCFSSCIKRVSLANPRINVPVRLKTNTYPDGHPFHHKYNNKLESLKKCSVIEKYLEIVEMNIQRFQNLKNFQLDGKTKAIIVSNDCRQIKLKDNFVDMVITSPPYAGAQKYIRSSSLNLGWLGYLDNLSLRDLKEKSIGREMYKKVNYSQLSATGLAEADKLIEEVYTINPVRAYIAANYLNEMGDAFTEVIRTLKTGGYFILVAGNNMICGKEFETQKYLSQLLEEKGLQVVFKLIDNIQSYGLMTKRNKTADIITREWVLVYQKI